MYMADAPFEIQLKSATHLNREGWSDRQEWRSPGTSDRSVVGTPSWDTWSPGSILRGTGKGHYPPAEYSGNTASTAPHAPGATLVTETSCRGKFSEEGTCEKWRTMYIYS